MKTKTYPWMPEIPWLREAMQSCLGVLAINWLCQGMRGMDHKELSFRLLLQLGVTFLCFLLLLPFYPSVPAFLASLLLAHTFNWLVNGQLWVCIRYCPAYARDPSALGLFLDRTASELFALPWLEEAVCIGSSGRRGSLFTTRSDIDLRLIFPPGKENWWRTNLLLLKLRTKALFQGIPLDLYAYDTPASLKKFSRKEKVWLIKDKHQRLEHFYRKRKQL